MTWLKSIIKTLFGLGNEHHSGQPWDSSFSEILFNKVAFYRVLNETDRKVFEQRVQLFWKTTKIDCAEGMELTDTDRLLVGASAIIPVWGFPKWHYLNLSEVILLPGAFNEQFKVSQSDSRISGMVGTGLMAGKMALSKPHLHLGFENTKDKRNVGIHEFAHLLDMSDGSNDGFPERMAELVDMGQWNQFVDSKIAQIEKGKSNIRDYGATNYLEFFAVATEYFFERPKMLKRKHPQLFNYLESFYNQDVMAIADDVKPRKK